MNNHPLHTEPGMSFSVHIRYTRESHYHLFFLQLYLNNTRASFNSYCSHFFRYAGFASCFPSFQEKDMLL